MTFFFFNKERKEEQYNMWCFAGEWEDGGGVGGVGGALNGCMYDVPTIRLRTYLLLRSGCFIFFAHELSKARRRGIFENGTIYWNLQSI